MVVGLQDSPFRTRCSNDFHRHSPFVEDRAVASIENGNLEDSRWWDINAMARVCVESFEENHAEGICLSICLI